MGILRTDRITGLGGANAIDGSAHFQGSHDGTAWLRYIDAGISDDYNFGTGDFTIECWINRSTLSNDDAIWATPEAEASSGFFWYFNSSGNLRAYVGGSEKTSTSNSIITDRWYHVAITRASGTMQMWVDGVSKYSASVTGTVGSSTQNFIIGDGNTSYSGNAYMFLGHISNLRIQKGKAEYTATFTPPTTRLNVTPETVLLALQSPGNVLAEATGKTLSLVQSGTIGSNSASIVASRFTPNSPVGFSTTSDVGSQYGSTFDGFGSFATSTYMVPPGGNTRERNRGRGLIMGGAVSPGATNTTQIKYFDIAAGGITEDFGQTTVARRSTGSFSSSTRAVMGGGFIAPPAPYTISDVIDFVTIASTANAIDFGNMQSTGYAYGTASNQTRGLFAGGYRPNNSAVVNTIDLITIATTANASNFGDLTRQVRSFGGFSSSTRGVFAGGTYPAVQDVIDFVTFSTTGDATDFGNLTDARDHPYGASSSTRGVMAGGRDPNTTNIIDYITIATAGNAIDFGDLTSTSYYFNSATANSTRAVWVGTSTIVNSMEYVTIATTGNATDFGDQNGTAQHSNGACSDSHGGIS